MGIIQGQSCTIEVERLSWAFKWLFYKSTGCLAEAKEKIKNLQCDLIPEVRNWALKVPEI